MKKDYIKFIIFSVFCFSIINIYAASLSIECDSSEVTLGDVISCNLNIEYEEEEIKKVQFDYLSDFAISFNNANINLDGNTVIVSFENILHATSKKKTTIGIMNVNILDSLDKGEHSITLENVKYQNSNNEEVDIGNISKIINVLPKPEDCRLSSITINNIPIDNFSSDVYSYNVDVTDQRVFIDVTKIGDKVSIVGLGTFRVKNGQTIIKTITISDERNNSKEYTLTIRNTNQEPVEIPSEPEVLPEIISKSGDNTIKEMSFYYNGKKLDFKYDASKTHFNYKIQDNTIDKIEVRANLNDSKAKFDDLYSPKEFSLNFGHNEFEIIVIAENQDLKVYSLDIEKEDFRDKNNHLSSIKINDREIELEDDKYSYEISLKEKVSLEDLEIIAMSDKSKVKYEEFLLPDEATEINITVTAENGEEKDYNIKVNPLKEGELENITVKNYNLSFKKDVYDYDITLKNNEKKLDITVLPNDLEYDIIGNENLKDGSKIIIKYSYQENVKEYVINIHQAKAKIPSIVCYIVFAVGIGIFTYSIIYYLKKKKK